jgi:DNA-binding NarL/FixJ family response regulator
VTKDIVQNLRLSPATVSVHRAKIMQKLGLHNSAALAALAVRAKLI